MSWFGQGDLRRYILTTMGSMTLYHMQTDYEFMNNKPPNRVYWESSVFKAGYGPFTSIHDAMNHYTYTISTRKEPVVKNNVIYVDFKKKKRL